MLSVLHVFENHLPLSQAWLYQLLSGMKQVDNHYIALNYLDNSFLERSKVLGLNLATIRGRESSFSIKNRLFRKVDKIMNGFEGSQKKLIRKNILSTEFQVVHFHFASIACDFLDEISQCKSKVFVSFYGYDYEQLPKSNSAYLALYKRLFGLDVLLLTEGNFGKNKLIALGAQAEKVQVQKLGVDTTSINYRRPKRSTNQLKLVQIADFRQKKGQIDTVKAVHHALINDLNVHLKFVGRAKDKSTYDEVVSYINTHNLSEQIVIESWVDYSKIHTLLAAFDVFIHPSKYSKDRDCEGGAPIILLDAQAVGLPIISTIHCDIPEEVMNGETGLLVEEGNIEQLTEAINYFYNIDLKTLDSYSRKANTHVLENYDINQNAKILEQKYIEQANG